MDNRSQKLNIVYLEDDPDSIELVSFTLGLDDFTVTTVSGFDEAIELARRGTFDLYLLDGLVDSGYSFDLCRRLKEVDPATPVVFYTALGFPQDIKDGIAAGADAYLVKPFSGDLAQTLRRTIEEKRLKMTNPHCPPVSVFTNSAARP